MDYPKIRKINYLVWHIDGKQIVTNPDEPGQTELIEPFVEKLYWKYKHSRAEAQSWRNDWKREQLRATALKGWLTRLRKEIEFQTGMREQERVHYRQWRTEGEIKIDKLDQDLTNMRQRVEGAERTNKALMHQNDELRKRIADLENPKPAEPFKLSNWAENRTDPPDEKIPNLRKSIY